MKRYVRVDGIPTHIEATFTDAPPRKLYEVLFRELAQVDISPLTITYQYGTPREGQVGHGYFGTEHIGVRWTEGYSTMTPMYVADVSYGLPKLQIYWQYQWHSGGHAPSTYHHSQLEVEFGHEQVADRFIQIWQQVFGQAPFITDLTTEESDTLEKRLIHKSYATDSTDLQLARNKTTAAEILARLAAQSSAMDVLYQIAANPSTPAHVLRDLWQHPHVIATRAAVEHSPYGLTTPFFGSDEDFLERLVFAIAAHPHTPSAILTELVQSTDEHIRRAVKRNPNVQPPA